MVFIVPPKLLPYYSTNKILIGLFSIFILLFCCHKDNLLHKTQSYCSDIIELYLAQ